MQAVVVWKVAFRMFYTAVIALKDITTRKGLVMFVLFMLHKRKKNQRHIQSVFLCVCLTGVTVEDTLDKITLRPDLYPKTSKKVPDVNFFYRYLCYFRYFFLCQKHVL